MLTGAAPAAPAATSLPCDLYAAGGTPCVAAHSAEIDHGRPTQ
ncbi:arabinofuranosidase catalytic domain-containing protein [Streptomyces sp. CoH27]